MQLVNDEHYKMLCELRKAIDSNTAKINCILRTDLATDTQPQSSNKPFATPQVARKRRRLQEGEDRSSNSEFPVVCKVEGTKEIDTDIVLPLAATQRESKFYLYLSGFAPQAEVNEIANLVQRNLNTDETVEVSKLVPKGKNLCELTFVSFKVGIGHHLKDLALQSSSGQKGITFREFDFGKSTPLNNFRK